jgi:hypothetical protein
MSITKGFLKPFLSISKTIAVLKNRVGNISVN